jgi:transposase
LRGFGLKVGAVTKGRFVAWICALIAGQPMLERVIEPMLHACEALRTEFHALHRALLGIVRHDGVCRRLMTVPGVGALVAVTFTSAIDDPARFRHSRAIGAYFGLTPKKYQSGETDVTGGISKAGDAMVRTALYESAHVMLTRNGSFSTLKRWALEVARRRGLRRAKVALARKLAIVLHSLWVEAACFASARRQRPRDRVAQASSSGAARFVLPRRGPVAWDAEAGEAGSRQVVLPSGLNHAHADWLADFPLTA